MGIMTNIKGFLGYMNLGKNKKEKAEKYFSEAYESGMTKDIYLLSYGALLMQKHDYVKCKEVYQRALSLDTEKANVKRAIVCSIAVCDYKLGNKEEAIEKVKALYDEDNKSSTVYTIYGYFLMREGQLDEALKVNLEGYSYDEDDVSVLDNLGQTYLAMGDKENAKKFFELAVEEKNTMPDSCYYLAEMYMEDGDLRKAKKLLMNLEDVNFSALTTVTREEVDALLEKVVALASEENI